MIQARRLPDNDMWLDCVICGVDSRQSVVSEVKSVWQEPYPVCFCASCGLYQLGQMPSQAQQEELYSKEYYVDLGALEVLKKIFRIARSRSQYAYVQQFIATGRSALEVGAGDGVLLSLFSRNFESLNGLEYSARYVQSARRQYNIELKSDNFFEASGSHDLLLMSHTLEHFSNVSDVMEKSLTILKPGGFFFIEIPNSPVPEEVSRDDLAKYLNTTHTFNFTTKSIVNLAKKHKFEILDCARFTYDLHDRLPKPLARSAAESLLYGKILDYRVSVPLLLYGTKCLFDPAGSYRKVKLSEPWEGFGDNIRVMLRNPLTIA